MVWLELEQLATWTNTLIHGNGNGPNIYIYNFGTGINNLGLRQTLIIHGDESIIGARKFNVCGQRLGIPSMAAYYYLLIGVGLV